MSGPTVTTIPLARALARGYRRRAAAVRHIHRDPGRTFYIYADPGTGVITAECEALEAASERFVQAARALGRQLAAMGAEIEDAGYLYTLDGLGLVREQRIDR